MASNQEHKEVQVKSNDTVQATLSIVISNESRQDPFKIYGRISGRFDIGSQFALFDKSSSNPVTVMPGHNIPLDMSKVDVPSSANTLEISTNLYDYGVIDPSNELPNGRVAFPVRQPGETTHAAIHGMNGNVLRFNVVWG